MEHRKYACILHKDAFQYIAPTRYEIIEDERYNERFAEIFRDELSDQQIMVLLHYVLRPVPDFNGAGKALKEYISPVMDQLIGNIREEHRSANTGVSGNDPDKS